MDQAATSALSQLEVARDRVGCLKTGLDSVDRAIQLHKDFVREQFSPVVLLPVEILCHIFSLLVKNCHRQPNSDDIRAVSQVSQSWRTIAIAHSTLWENPDLDNWNPKWIKVCLSRSGNRPLSVRFNGYSERHASHEYINALVSHADRLASVEILGPTQSAPFTHLIDQILRPVASLPHPALSKLQLRFLGDAPPVYHTFPIRIPSLRKLQLYRMAILDLSTASEELTSLSLSGINAPDLAPMLASSPHLRQLAVSGGYSEMEGVVFSRSSIIHLPSLETLFLSQTNYAEICVLTSVQMPKLDTLIFSLVSDDCIMGLKLVMSLFNWHFVFTLPNVRLIPDRIGTPYFTTCPSRDIYHYCPLP